MDWADGFLRCSGLMKFPKEIRFDHEGNDTVAVPFLKYIFGIS